MHYSQQASATTTCLYLRAKLIGHVLQKLTGRECDCMYYGQIVKLMDQLRSNIIVNLVVKPLYVVDVKVTHTKFIKM